MSCADFKSLITSTPFLLVLCGQTLGSISSIVVTIIAIRRCRSLPFHMNCKILMITIMILYIIHSICIAVLQIMQLIRYLIYGDPCEAAISSVFCFCLRFPATICMTSFAVLQLGMITERAIAVWKRTRYEAYGTFMGYSITSCCVLASTALTSWAFMEMNFSTKTVYCSAGTVETVSRVKILSFILCGVDCGTLAVSGFVCVFNIAAGKRNLFDLKSSYQLKENVNVLRVILPVSVFLAISHSGFCIANAIISMYESSFSIVTYRTLYAGTYIIPYYTVLAPTLLLFILKWSHQDRTTKLKVLSTHALKENEVYFNTYSQMWKSSMSNK